jgi:hypothetical protein
MAEEKLYGNLDEPHFPYERVVNRLSWLPSFLGEAEQTHRQHFNTLLNTVLVFGRVRTAAMGHIACLNPCRKLVSALNSVLDDAGEEGKYHRMEIVRRGPQQFFVTCTNSPRFIWKPRLTHVQVGRNLDYFAAGHMFSPPFPPRAEVSLVERLSLRVVSTEWVSLESLDDNVFRGRLKQFNDDKQELVNQIMKQFGLPYRFKWALNCPDHRRNVAAVMSLPTPPSETWWDDNCLIVNRSGETGRNVNYVFCNFHTNYREFWTLLQCLYSFSKKYDNIQYRNIASQCGFDYWETMKNVFVDAREASETSMGSEERDLVVEKIKSRLKELEYVADAYVPPPDDDWHGVLKPDPIPLHPVVRFKFYICRRTRFFIFRLRVVVNTIELRVFQRQKLRAPLSYNLFPVPKECIPEVFWF